MILWWVIVFDYIKELSVMRWVLNEWWIVINKWIHLLHKQQLSDDGDSWEGWMKEWNGKIDRVDWRVIIVNGDWDRSVLIWNDRMWIEWCWWEWSECEEWWRWERMCWKEWSEIWMRMKREGFERKKETTKEIWNLFDWKIIQPQHPLPYQKHHSQISMISLSSIQTTTLKNPFDVCIS